MKGIVNMSKKIYSLIVLVICVITIFTGCFPSSESSQESKITTLDTANVKKESHIKKSLSSINIDANIVYPKANSFNTYKAEMVKFDWNKLKSIFIKDKNNIKVLKDTNTDYSGYPAYILNSDNENLGIFRDFFEYTTSDYDDLSYFLTSQDYPVGFEDMVDCFKSKQLSSIDKEDALETVMKVMNKLNLPVNKNPEIYSLDSKSLNSRSVSLNTEKEYKEMNMKYKFSKSDEAYLFVFHSQTNSLNHCDRFISIFQDGIPSYGGEVYAVVNSKGLIMFGAYGMYDIKETLSKDKSIIDTDTVFNIINNKYKNIKAEVTVVSLEPCYFPIKKTSTAETAELTPVWIVKTDESVTEQSKKGNTTINSTQYYIIDAVTGKVIR